MTVSNPMSGLPWISADARITVPRLEAEDARWAPAEDVSSTPIRATALSYRRDVRDELLFLLAKRYEVPVAHAVPADELGQVVFRRTYERGFAQVDIVKTSWVDVGPARFFEIAWELVHAKAGPVRKIERIAVEGPFVHVISAEGTPNDLERHRDTVLRWLDGARFEGLGARPTTGANGAGVDAPNDELAALLAQVDAFRARGRDGDALELATATHVRAHLEHGDDHASTIGALSRRGAALRALGRLEASRGLLIEARDRAAKALAPDHGEAITTAIALGETLVDLGALEEAEQVLDAAFAQTDSGACPLGVKALAEAARGHLRLLRGQRPLAEASLQSALTILRDDLATRLAADEAATPSPSLWRTLHDLGRLAGESGQLEAAEPYLTAALDGRRESFGDAHPDTIESFVSLGTLYLRAKEPALADPVLRKALEATRAAFGPTHPAVADRLVDVAMTCNALGAAAVIEPLLAEALAIRTAALGPTHRDTVWIEGQLTSLRAALAARGG